MSFQYSPFVLPLIAAALISAAVAVYAWMRRSATGALPLSLLAVSIFVWTVGYSFEIMGIELETKYLWGAMQYVGIAYSTYSWLIFSITYSGQKEIITRRFVVSTVFIPSLTILFALTTKWHGLIWSEYHIDQHGDFSALGVSHGFWFFVHFAYSYLILLIGAIFLVRALWRRRGMYRGQIAAMLVAVLAPWVGNVLYLTGNSPILYLDLTPFAFTVTVIALAWAIFGFRLVDITPLARDLVLESMRDGMIVLDVRGNIVDINNAASHMIGIPAANAIGKTAGDVFSPWSHLVERFASVMEAKDEIAVGEGEAERRYEVRLSPLHGQQGQFMGRVIMLRALDETAPQPRFARSAASQSDTRPYYRVEMETTEDSPPKKNPVLRALVNFYNPPMNNRLVVPNNINPIWYRTRERMFTLVARLTATSVAIGWVFFILAPFRSVAGSLVLAMCLGVLLTLGQVRNVNYHTRVVAFFSLVYAFALIATLNFGFSAPSIVFFMFYVVASAALTSPRGAFYALFTGILTVGICSILIGSGTFTPFMLALAGDIFPFSLLSGLGAVFLFGASAFIILTSIVLLLDNLDRAWQKETQTLNLLQQERDLLEQRVTERTHALSTARDEAVKTSNDLRKYFRAIEQSGSTIVITDTDGRIEYANPRFEQSTGYSIADAIGKNPRLLKSGRQDAEYYRRLWKTIGDGEVWNGEFLNRRRDGSLYWEYATIAPVMDQNGVITNYVAIKEDITERKNVETQLLKLSQAVEQSGNTVIIMDKNGLMEYVNPKFSEVTGYSAEEALGKSPITLMNGIERAPDFSQDEWWLTVSAGQIWHGEFRNHRKNGSVFWEAATIAPVFNRDSEVINFVEIKQDITEQKIMQDQLQKQNDYLSILHQITLDLLNRREHKDLLQVIVDRSSILLDAPYSKLLLEKDGELIVEAFTGEMLNMEGERAPSKLSWQAFDSHQPVVLEDYQTWEDRLGEYDNLSLHAIAEIPVMAGNRCLGVLALARTEPDYKFTAEQVETGILFVRLVALVLDNASLYDSAVKEIVERKRTQALLQESEARFRQIVESASDIIYRTDVDGNFTYFNPTGVIILGYQHETELLGKNYQELAIPEWRHKLKGFYRRQFFKKEKNTYFEFPAVNPNGEVIWLGQSVQIIEENDAVVGFQAVARDITKLIQAQDALALSRDQALDASRFKSQLLSRVSHELRTPLGGILGYAELLGYKAFGALTEQQKKAVDSIIESTNYLTSVVNDLLDEAQIESKSLSLYNEYFNPVELLENTRASMSVLAVKKGLTFVAEMDPDLPAELYGDINRLRQILVNLEGNAVKFTKEGEVSVRFKRPTPAQWSIEVCDTGAGISIEDQQTIFEPFRQLNNSITRGNRGSGLGLAITKQLVELMGGKITLESQVGKGSLFTVVLPIINAPGE